MCQINVLHDTSRCEGGGGKSTGVDGRVAFCDLVRGVAAFLKGHFEGAAMQRLVSPYTCRIKGFWSECKAPVFLGSFHEWP